MTGNDVQPISETKNLKNILLEARAAEALASARLANSDAALREEGLKIAQAEAVRQHFLDREAAADAESAELRTKMMQENLKQEIFATENVRIGSEDLRRAEETLLASNDENHVYSFYEPFTDNSVAKCINALTLWDRKSPACPIEVVFHSPGGGVFAGMHLFDFLVKLGKTHEVKTVALGMAASMGGIIMQAGTVRVMGGQSYMMLHEISSGVQGKSSDIEDQLELLKKIEKRVLNIFESRSNLTARSIQTLWKKKDVWMDADECLDKGLIDEIL